MGAKSYQGKVVWITGGGTGIGRAIALEYASQGATVVVSGRRQEKLDAVADTIGKDHQREALAQVCDVTKVQQLEGAVEAIKDQFGRLDVVVANAGFGVIGTIEELTQADWRRQFETNVIGLAQTVRFSLPMLKESEGRVVLVGSIAAFIFAKKNAPYCASKAAVRVIGETLREELRGTGVSCTTVHPGLVQSDIAKVNNNNEVREDWEDRRPAHLMWKAEDAAKVIVRAADKRKREFIFTNHGKVAAFAGRHFPGVLHTIMGLRSSGS